LGYSKNLGDFTKEYWRKNRYHYIFTKIDEPAVELHWALDYPRKKQLLSKKFKRIRETVILKDKNIKMLSPEDTFFSLILHKRRLNLPVSLRDTCDLARLLKKYEGSFDWDYVLSEAKNAGLCSTVFFALYQVKFFYGIKAPEYAYKSLGLPFWKKALIMRFIEKNTFFSEKGINKNYLYLKAYFLLFDNLWEPVEYILNIPKDQFMQFYGIASKGRKTDFLYHARIVYMPFRGIYDFLKKDKSINERCSIF